MAVCAICRMVDCCAYPPNASREDTWPNQTTYQADYGRPRKEEYICPKCKLRIELGKPKVGSEQYSYQPAGGPQTDVKFMLAQPAPPPIVDRHITGGVYPSHPHPTWPQNGYPQVALTGGRGIDAMSPCDRYQAEYTPNYRHRDWVDRPNKELVNDMSYTNVVVHLPQQKTKYFYEYNEKMGKTMDRSSSTPFVLPCSSLQNAGSAHPSSPCNIGFHQPTANILDSGRRIEESVRFDLPSSYVSARTVPTDGGFHY